MVHVERPQASPTSACGFTLVEVLAVMAIIAVLAGIILGIAGYASRKSDRSRAIADMERLKNALEEYRVQKSAYPSGVNLMLYTNDLAKFVADLRYVDPWGRNYSYSNDPSRKLTYRLWSDGPLTGAANRHDDVDSSTGNY